MEFKEIPSFPGYRISKEGVILGKTGKQLKGKQIDTAFSFLLYRNGKQLERPIHSLLAETWFIDGWIAELDEGEEWKYMIGFEDYIITSRGRIWSQHCHRWLTPTPASRGRYQWMISLKKNKKQCTREVHSLVGRHFLPDYKEGLNILHYEEELPFPEINYVDNLWCGTHQDNTDDKMKKGRGGHRKNKLGFPNVDKGADCKSFSYRIRFKKKVIRESGFKTPKDAYEGFLKRRMELKGY